MSQLARSRIITLIAIVVGSFVFSFGLNAFILPHNLVSSGLTGINILFFYLTGIPIGVCNFILNIPIILAAYKWLGKWQVFLTFIGTIIISIAIDLLFFLRDYNFTQDPIIGSLLGGLTSGLGLGIVYRFNGNTGGLDPIALIIRKFWGLQMGNISLGLNALVLILAIFVSSIEASALTLINIYIAAVVMNKVIVGFNQRKAVFIISNKSQDVAHMITTKLGRGATLLNGEGAYTHQERQVIMVVVNLLQVSKLKSNVESIDPSAFMLITDTAEVIGQGFTYKQPKPEQMRKWNCDPDTLQAINQNK